MDYPAYMLVMQVIFRPTEWRVLHLSCNTEQNMKHGLVMQL